MPRFWNVPVKSRFFPNLFYRQHGFLYSCFQNDLEKSTVEDIKWTGPVDCPETGRQKNIGTQAAGEIY